MSAISRLLARNREKQFAFVEMWVSPWTAGVLLSQPVSGPARAGISPVLSTDPRTV